MIGNKKVLGLITARGGSKGVPRKNVRDVGGKPLIAWTIEAANASSSIDRLVLSSDDDEIIAAAKAYGCDVPFVRSAELATDTASSIDVIRDALQRTGDGFDYLVLLQPTSPLRTAADIDGAVALCDQRDATGAVSATEAEKSPYWMFDISDDGRMRPLFSEMPANRQSAPKVYVLNGAVYVTRIDHLRRGGSLIASDTLVWIMPRERSVDIDTEDDLAMLNYRLSRPELD